MPNDEKQKFELSDVDVETLGLVFAGANREDFFMVKSAEASTNDSENDSEDEDKKKECDEMQEADKSEVGKDSKKLSDLGRRFVELIVNTAKEILLQEKSPASVVEASTETVDNNTVASEAEIIESAKEEEVTETIKETMSEPVTESDVVEATEKATIAEVTVEVTELSKESNMSEENQVDVEKYNDLVSRLEKAEQALVIAKEEKERSEFISKARSLSALPLSPGELADHMYWLSKTDQARYEWFAAVMQTMDNHLVDNQLWLEKGVNYAAEATDAVTKATRSANPRDELLKVGRDDAMAYLRTARKPGREV